MSLMKKAGDAVYYDPAYRRVLESHLPILRDPGFSTVEIIEADEVHQYEGDLFGLLHRRGIPAHEHWIVMRVNGFENPNQFGREMHHAYRTQRPFQLRRPDGQVLEQILKRHLTKNE